MVKTSKNSGPSDKPLENDNNANDIWGGRFDGGPAEIMLKINASIDFDRRLFAQDINASKAHAIMLASTGIISQNDSDDIVMGLDTIFKEIKKGEFNFSQKLEDIHMNVESRLGELIGSAAGRLHTARSRNDQVATDLRLWVREEIDKLDDSLKALQSVLIDRAEDHASTVMPGFTHLQTAQPVTLGHHLLAYVEMLGRDRGRLSDCRDRLNESPLGAAALGGTSFPIDRYMTAKELGFSRPMANSIDAVSDRDFVLEYLSIAAILGVHMSRFAEEIVLWCSVQFSYVHLSDSFSTGSSIMPQKRNPDAAELVRAKVGNIIGALNTLLVVMKGLPLAYSKDMQEDKLPVFTVTDTLNLCLAALIGMVGEMDFDKDRMQADAISGHAMATDLADWFVKDLNMPFRDAHHVTGLLVRLAEEKKVELNQLSVDEMQSISPGITNEIYKVLRVTDAVSSRSSFGGTAPKMVLAAVLEARKRYLNI
ncbi:MAG: argininosuccinate lyase [Pseudomonadota bacterium]|nr:argininosuccinate lyase [Pseudomonadota bacterium]